jgi:CRP-like cAMP-binding protein
MQAPSDPGLALLHATLSAFGTPPSAQWPEFVALFRPRALSKGEHWLLAGELPSSIAFVGQGLLRMYYLGLDGKQHNKTFVQAGDFAAALEALLCAEPSTLSVQALAPCTLWVADYARFAEFFERDMYWQRLGRRFAEQLCIKKARREAQLLMCTAPQRYARFRADYGPVEEQLPDLHIASYLGITPEAFSRLKRDLRRS